MEKVYDHTKTEDKIYHMWEKGGYFKPQIDPTKKPFTIVLPPPNASGRMHTGNVLMIAIEDLLIRWHRMKGDPTLWIPGTDHAGTETQITFERELKKQGKSRFNYSREELYKAIWDFVQNNKGLIESQIRQMGASIDWSRYTFTLDPNVVTTVHNTFKKMYGDGLIYKDKYMVNYCPQCGTTYADVELKHEERKDPLYYMKYRPFTIATVRPESKFRDTALAVNPKDKRYKDWLGKTLDITGLLGTISLKIIPDPEVDPEFGTGIMKVTPAHDPHDFELGKKFNLPVLPIIDLNGRMDFSWFLEKKDIDSKYMDRAKKYHGKKVLEARKLMVEDLKEDGLLIKTDESYTHTIPLCKAGHLIEPTVLPNWFVRVDDKKKSFKKPALEAIKEGKIKIFPKWQEIKYIRWMEEMRDWPISRQNIWGIRIPVWYCLDCNPKSMITFKNTDGSTITLDYSLYKQTLNTQGFLMKPNNKEVTFDQVEKGLQTLITPSNATYFLEKKQICSTCDGKHILQETDTFDTWFSSGQWPLVTLGYPDSKDFKYFYPTSVLETGWEILRLWVSRMIMFGIYLTGEVPFEYVYLHGIVKALDGRKMSKSLGNMINPDEYINQYGVDALRMGLISGTANGKDFSFPKDRVIAYKHFANKIWNMARFMLLMIEEYGQEVPFYSDDLKKKLAKEDKEIVKELEKTILSVEKYLEKFRFADAAEVIYQFMWHEVADKYIERVKNREDKDIALSVLRHVYIMSLKLLHPFMPFVTEEIWGLLPKQSDKPLIISSWPK